MAEVTSGSKTVEIFSWIDMKFSWSQVEQSIANNTTKINWSLKLITNANGAVYKKNRTWSVTIDGTTYSGTVNVSVDKSSTQTVASGTATITHGSDGSKTFAYSFSQQFELTLNSGRYMSTYTGSGTDTLTSIPKASTLSIPSDGVLRQKQTLTVTKRSESFTNTITWTCGTTSGTICTKSSAESFEWTPSIELATHYPQSTSVSVTFTIKTYDGSDQVGSISTTASYAVPSDIVPPVASVASDPVIYVDNKSIKEYYGAFVQGKSKLKLDITTYGVYGSWIKSCKAEFDGKASTEPSAPNNSVSFTFDSIKGSGTIPIKITSTDSRGRTTVENSSVTVLAYEPPTITDLSAFRSDASGKAMANGAYLTVKFSSFVHSLNNNNGAWHKVVYKKSGTTEETTVSLTAYDMQYSLNNCTYTFPADTCSYDIVVKAGDRFNTTSKSVAGASAIKTISMLKKAGKIVGMAFGKLAELENVFDIAFQTRFNGGILHTVLPTNTDLDNEKTPKTYMLPSTSTYTNVPETGVGMFLEIVGSKSETITQRISVFSHEKPRTYERAFYYNEWGAWIAKDGDYVIEYGEKDGWSYRKWNRGTAECWKILTHTTKISKTWGSMYVGDTLMERQNYPITFTSKPVEVVSLTSGSPAAWLFAESQGNGVNGAYASAIYNVCRPSANSTENTFYLSFHVTGKWK